MNSDVLQFQCSACQTVLTVPSHMAGVTGPCPVCGQTITSPGSPEPTVPLFTTPPAVPAVPPAPIAAPEACFPPAEPPFPPVNLGFNPGLNPNSGQGLSAGNAGLNPSLNPGLTPGNPGLNPVMPMPNSITRHLNPISPNLSTPPADGAFLNAPPTSVVHPAHSPVPADHPSPPWQQPGLGQTLLGGLPQPPPMGSASGFPSSFPPPSSPGLQNPNTPPPQREPVPTPAPITGASQSPWNSVPPKNEVAPANDGLGFFGNRPATGGAPTHSSLIPGSPSLPSQSPATAPPPAQPESGFGSPKPGPSGFGSSLLSREISAVPPASAKSATPTPPPVLSTAEPTKPQQPPFTSTAPSTTPAAPPTSKVSQPLKKPSQSSNIFMRALAAVFLIGFLVAAGWMFRAPLKQLVSRFSKPAPEPVAFVLPEPDPNYKPEDDEKSPEKTETPKVTEPEAPVATTPVPNVAETPTSQEMAPPRAEVPTTEELAALRTQPSASGLTEVPTQTPSSPPSGAAAETPAAPGTTVKNNAIKIETTEEGKPAAEALIKFLKAKNITERLRYTLGANSMKPLMERYYQAQPDGPLHIDAIGLVRLDRKPQMGKGTHALFGVESRDWEFPVPVMLEEGKDGFQVDWLSFVEFKDRLLEKFFDSYQDGAARFHVGITRTHYFDDKVPNSDNKDAFTISPAPPNPYQTTIFVEKDSQLGRELKDRIPWGSQVWAIVDLEWVKLGNQQWVQLVGVPQLNWYSVPNESKAGKSSELPNEIQRAVPVGR